jgi:protoheme ferro-lyase
VDQEEVTGFLERIFLANAGLEDESPGGAEARARFLADARAPALTDIYRAIGGSPLMPQLQAKREGLEKELARRDLAIPVTLGTQFLTPSISDAVLWCQENEVERIVGLTTYLERLPYTHYVEALCSAIANSLGDVKYVLGYQNHGNRPIPWVEPDNETLMPSLDADRVVVVPISFIQEQSETLSELDHDLSDLARSQGLDFYRVPVPHDSSALLELMADLVEAALASPGAELLRGCNCNPGAWCTNGGANES